MILYLHGFLSSPDSRKARQLGAALQAAGRGGEYLCPALPFAPLDVQSVLLEAVSGIAPDHLCVVGSSLGGFYAAWLAERTGCRALLINPAVRPFEALAGAIGTHRAYGSGEPVIVLPEHLEQLRAMHVEPVTQADRYFLIAATGDEVLDYRDMVAFYQGCRIRLVEGSDHALSDFEQYLPEVLAFCAAPDGLVTV